MLNWSWKHKMGEIDLVRVDEQDNKTKHHYKLGVYHANCVCAIVSKWKDKETGKNVYQLYAFFNDFEHLKRCIGLQGRWVYLDGKRVCEKENIYKQPSMYWNKIKLNTAYDGMLKMGTLLAKAGFRVELYREDIQE